MNESQAHIYRFGEFSVDAAKRLLLKGGDEIVPLMPKAFDTLLYLVSHSGKVIEKDEIMREIWSDTIVEENNLTQNISILRRVLGEKHGENRFIATVPGRGYKFVASVRETVPADPPESPPLTGGATAAEPESSPEPEISKNKLEDQNQKPEIKNQTRNPQPAIGNRTRLTGLIFVILIICGALGFYLWRDRSKPAGSDARIKIVAILPFKPLVADNRNEALEMGMADTLISKLSAGEEIVIRPLSAIRRYNSVEQDSVAAGRELGVEAVLDGTIQTSGNRVRVSTKLLRTSDGRQLWAAQFDEKFTDIFAVQDSISERVAAALKIRLGNVRKKRPTENIEAYQLYMKGRYHTLNLTRAETDKGIAYFEQAIEIDPAYALAYVGLARAYLPMALTSGMPSWEVMPKAKAAALRAVELDETLAEAHAALGFIIFWYDWNWQAAEKQFRRALELDPNSAEAHFGYAHLLSNTGRHEQALAEIKLSRELDPVSLGTNALEGQILGFAGKHDEAIYQLKRTIDLNPNFWLSHLFISDVYAEKGMYAEAADELKKAGELSGNLQSDAYRAYVLTKWGKHAEARAVLDGLLNSAATRYVAPYNLAVVYNGLGEKEKALDYLEKAFAEKNPLLVFLKVDPKWNNLRAEPRFVALMKQMNFE